MTNLCLLTHAVVCQCMKACIHYNIGTFNVIIINTIILNKQKKNQTNKQIKKNKKKQTPPNKTTKKNNVKLYSLNHSNASFFHYEIIIDIHTVSYIAA